MHEILDLLDLTFSLLFIGKMFKVSLLFFLWSFIYLFPNVKNKVSLYFLCHFQKDDMIYKFA